jgi:peptidoglycan hydrolase-like protein with peptidoglycan-binding domain
MPLSSPRFKDETELKAVEAGSRVLKNGVSGRHVHLVQMALIDLGFPMPQSTKSDHFSPDGIYGPETTEVVKAFQRATPLLEVDGEIGQHTMRALDAKFPSFTHRVNLYFRSLALSDVAFDRILSGMQRVYGQYGIDVRFASGESLKLSEEEQKRFNVVKQNCEWDMDTGEFAELEKLGDAVPHNDVAVYIVDRFQEVDLLGCGGHAKDRPACAVAHNCGRYDVAHETCHVLLTSGFNPVHALDQRNLMHATATGEKYAPTLTEKQLAKIRASPLCRML